MRLGFLLCLLMPWGLAAAEAAPLGASAQAPAAPALLSPAAQATAAALPMPELPDAAALTASAQAQAPAAVTASAASALSPSAQALGLTRSAVPRLVTTTAHEEESSFAFLSAPAGTLPSEFHGLILGASLSQLWVDGGQPLGYRLELGWEFEGGWALKSGIESFYYQARAADGKRDYSESDWVSTLLWYLPCKSALQPSLGVTFESVFGSSSLSQANASGSSAQNSTLPMTGLAPVAGLAWRPSPAWLVELQARALGSLTGGHLAAVTLGFARLF
jgi:hypothetical protein